MTNKTFWLSYDLGLKGDYNGLYTWLDNMSARECGANLAIFKKETEGNPIKAIQQDLQRYVKLQETDRIYLIYKLKDRVKGTFLAGKRKRPPWQGYSWNTEETDEDEDF